MRTAGERTRWVPPPKGCPPAGRNELNDRPAGFLLTAYAAPE